MKLETAKAALQIQTRALAAQEAMKDLRESVLKETKPLKAARYEVLAKSLRKLMKSDCSKPHEEFFRRAVTRQDYPGYARPKDLDECFAFVKTFHNRVGQLAGALDGVDTNRGDDGHSDLLDALGLAPNFLFEEIIKNPEDFHRIEKKHEKALEDLLHNELFNSLYLDEALDTYLPSEAGQMTSLKREKEEILPAHVQITHEKDSSQIWITSPDGTEKVELKKLDLLNALIGTNRQAEARLTKNAED